MKKEYFNKPILYIALILLILLVIYLNYKSYENNFHYLVKNVEIGKDIVKANSLFADFQSVNLDYVGFKSDYLFLNRMPSGLYRYNTLNEQLEPLLAEKGSFMFNDWIVCIPDNQKTQVTFLHGLTKQKLLIDISEFEKKTKVEWYSIDRTSFGYFDGKRYYFVWRTRENNQLKLAYYNLDKKTFENIANLDFPLVYANDDLIYWCINSFGKRSICTYSVLDGKIIEIDLKGKISGNCMEPKITKNMVYFYEVEDGANIKLYSIDLNGSGLELIIDYKMGEVQIGSGKWYWAPRGNTIQSGFISSKKCAFYSNSLIVFDYAPDLGAVGMSMSNRNGRGKGWVLLREELLENLVG